MGARQTRLAGALAAAWEAEVVSSRVLAAMADRTGDAKLRARLMVLSAFCRAHASRLLTRLSAMGRGPLPVPPDHVEIDEALPEALRREAVAARAAALRYEAMAASARGQSDLSSAWVCELNRGEEEGRASELVRLALELEREAQPPAEPFGLGF